MKTVLILFPIFIFLVSCSDTPVAQLNAKDCSIESTNRTYSVNELTLFSNDESINKKQISVSEDEGRINKINICTILQRYNIKMQDINLIEVSLINSKSELKHFVINKGQLDFIGKDTSLLLSEPVQ
jgi:hypothetical protein